MHTLDLNSLFEAELSRKAGTAVVLFPGRFQPIHAGHKRVYDKLQQEFGDVVRLYTSDDTSSFKSPFTFNEKRLIATRMFGIPGDHILHTSSPYSPPRDFRDPESTPVLFAVSKKDMDEDPRFSFPASGPALRRDGQPRYLQRYPGSLEQCEPMSKHGYVYEVEVEEFEVLGQSIDSATEVRKMLIGPEEDARKAFEQLYGRFDEKVFAMMRSKIEQKTLSMEDTNYDMRDDSEWLFEGGNVWKDSLKTERIAQGDIIPTVLWLEKITGLELSGQLLGSTGRKESSGDIDIGVTGITKEALIKKLNDWATRNDPQARVKSGGGAVHFRTPVRGRIGGTYVQTDFMFVPDLDFARWSMAANPSQYKGADRAIVLSSIAKHQGLKWSWSRGLINRTNDTPIRGGKDPDYIAKVLIGPSATRDDLDTVETIVAALKNHPERDEMLSDARDTISRKNAS